MVVRLEDLVWSCGSALEDGVNETGSSVILKTAPWQTLILEGRKKKKTEGKKNSQMSKERNRSCKSQSWKSLKRGEWDVFASGNAVQEGQIKEKIW